MASSPTDAAVALSRLGLGARPGEIDRVAADPRGWAMGQIRSQGAPQPSGQFADTAERVAQYIDYQSDAGLVRRDRRAAAPAMAESAPSPAPAPGMPDAADPQAVARREARQAARRDITQDTAQEFLARAQLGASTDDGVAERWALFWANANIPADVTELARALTGWSVPAARDQRQPNRPRRARNMAAQAEPGPDGFVFRANVHEPGTRAVMGKTYPAAGLAQGQAILRDLARHPATAKRLSRRLAAHFVADDPPPALVARLEAAWTRSGGDLAQVARALIDAPETWTPQPAKIKTPYEFIVSAHRALGTRPPRVQPLRQALLDMGQPPFSPPSPEGWPDLAADWAGPDALVKRLNWSRTAADAAQAADPSAVAASALGARLSERTRLAVARAESRPEALTLLFMSPEFQRR